jgi:Ca2+-binding RTX toxin-like protein
MSSQPWRGSASSLNTQTDPMSGLLPQYFNTSNPSLINLRVTSEQPDALGRLGLNQKYQMYSSPFWQRSIWLYTQEAVFSQDSTKIDSALKGLEFAFNQQLATGNFSFTAVPNVSVSNQQEIGANGVTSLGAIPFFMAAVGTALRTYQESEWFQTDSQNQSFRERLTALKPKIQKTLDFLTLDSNASRLQGDTRGTNRVWNMALAYYGAGKFLGDPKAEQLGLKFARKALSQFDSATGIFLENGGGDSSYQAVSIVFASRFSFLLDKTDPLRAQIQQAAIAAAAWEKSKILSTGEVSTEGNTRVYAGGESFLGNQKGIDATPVVVALSYAALFSNDQTYWSTAQRVSDFYSLNYTTPGSLSFSSASFSVNEDGTSVQAITVVRTGGSHGSVSASLWVKNGTAKDPRDYPYMNANPPVIRFADGDTTPKVIQLPIVNDTTREPNETLNLSLVWPQGRSTIGTQNTAVLTIVDNDPLPTVTVNPSTVSVLEANYGTTTFTFSVSLSHASSQTITVPFATQNGTAIAGADYLASSGIFTFNPGQVSQKITIRVNSDTIVEPEETFNIKLGTPTNAVLGTSAQTIVKVGDRQSGSAQTGSSGNDLLTGGAGSDTLSGGVGNDTLSGLTGNDFYYIENLGDIVVENLNAGIDTVRSWISYTLGANLERLGLQGSSHLTGTGNSFDNTIFGNAGNNQLAGLAGQDSLSGGTGNDTLAGGAGNDFLSGNLGNDCFVYGTGTAYVAGAIGADRLTDFGRTAGNTDKIVLSRTTFSAGTRFANVSTDALAATSSAFIAFSTSTGSLFYNQNGAIAGFGSGGQFAIVSNVNALIATDLAVVA